MNFEMFGGGGSVADFPETESVRYPYPSCRVAIARPQDGQDVAGAELARADVDQRADDRPHHLPAERSRGDVVAQHAVAQVVPARLQHAPHRGGTRGSLAAEP